MMQSPPRSGTEPDDSAGVEAEGQDAYPTYRDGAADPHRATASKPTDVDLPQSKRTFGGPMLIGLLAFAVIIVIAIIVGGVNLASTPDSASATAGPNDNAGAVLQGQTSSGQAGTGSGPGTVEQTPGAVDVPGGATTSPAPSAP